MRGLGTRAAAGQAQQLLLPGDFALVLDELRLHTEILRTLVERTGK
jgi:hypothetical protein